MSVEAFSEQVFDNVADKALRALEKALSSLEEYLEADLQSGILTLEFQDGVKYVVNSHRAARQIWMAAERSAWHFDYRPSESSENEEGRWISAKNGEELWSAVEAVITRKLGTPVSLSRPSGGGVKS